MRFAQVFLFVAVAGVCGSAVAQSIFNIQPAQPQGGQQKPAVVSGTPIEQQSSVSKPNQAQRYNRPAPDAKMASQFEQLPNESNDAYQNRLKVMSQRAIADLERASREHYSKIKELAPK